MDRNFNNRDFEQFVKQNADQYRMFPSEKVWQGIDNALHTRRRWYGLGLALLLFFTGAGVTWVMISTPSNKQQTASTTSKNTTTPATPITGKTGLLITPVTPEQIKTAHARKVNENAPFVFSDAAVARTNRKEIVFQSTLISEAAAEDITTIDEHFPSTTTTVEEVATIVPVSARAVAKKLANPSMAETETITILNMPVAKQPLALVYDEHIAEQPKEETSIVETKVVRNDIYPLTIESVFNSYQPAKPKKKVTFQVYAAPTVSYRKLSENKEFLQDAARSGTVPYYAAYSDVANYVTHKPDIGLEIGLSARYQLTNKLLIKAGGQFNVSRYDIRAFSAVNSETAVVTLDANPSNNSLERETIYRTRNGGSADWLQNLYYSVAIPIGVELKLKENKRAYFGIGSTIQPTYVINDRAYLISTDYKNYIDVPGSILRRFNINAGFEAFVGYSTNKINWQIGPQVRYQTRSTFKDKYPVKENLFDFGIKVGITFKK